MIEAGRPCADVAQQLHAVEKAVGEAKRTLIRDHLDHCLGDVFAGCRAICAGNWTSSSSSRNTSEKPVPVFADLLAQGSAHAWLFIPSAILLGALHGLEPGHSKT